MPWRPGTIRSVSYTHLGLGAVLGPLDPGSSSWSVTSLETALMVPFNSACRRRCSWAVAWASANRSISPRPVSYTHLDVYKRQLQIRGSAFDEAPAAQAPKGRDSWPLPGSRNPEARRSPRADRRPVSLQASSSDTCSSASSASSASPASSEDVYKRQHLGHSLRWQQLRGRDGGCQRSYLQHSFPHRTETSSVAHK